MNNLARKYQKEYQHQEFVQPTRSKQPKTKSSMFTKGEKFLFGLFAIVFCALSVKIVTAQASIYEVNRDIQVIEFNMNEQLKVQEDLQVKIKELSEYDRVLKAAKEQGLKMNENNVKVVQSK